MLRKIKFVMFIAVITLFFIFAVPYAVEDYGSFAGWDNETKEKVWDVYRDTDWTEYERLLQY